MLRPPPTSTLFPYTTLFRSFASDRFTVADPTQNTGRRVNLPLPDPLTSPSDYQDTQVLNTLDGFNLQPRLRSEEHTSELQSHHDLVCRLLLEKKNTKTTRDS